MNKRYGSYDETQQSVLELSSGAKKRGKVTGYRGAKWMTYKPKPRPNASKLPDMEYAIARGWCSKPVPMVNWEDEAKFLQMRRQALAGEALPAKGVQLPTEPPCAPRFDTSRIDTQTIREGWRS